MRFGPCLAIRLLFRVRIITIPLPKVMTCLHYSDGFSVLAPRWWNTLSLDVQTVTLSKILGLAHPVFFLIFRKKEKEEEKNQLSEFLD